MPIFYFIELVYMNQVSVINQFKICRPYKSPPFFIVNCFHIFVFAITFYLYGTNVYVNVNVRSFHFVLLISSYGGKLPLSPHWTHLSRKHGYMAVGIMLLSRLRAEI